MKKLKLFAFSLITFLCFGVISVNAETITINNLNDYKAAIADGSTATEIKLGANLDISSLDTAQSEELIYVRRDIVLDLNGYIMTVSSANIKPKFFGNHTFTVKDSSLAKTGKILSEESYDVTPIQTAISSDFACDYHPKLVLENITIESQKTDEMIYFQLPIPEDGLCSEYIYDAEIDGVTFINARQLFNHSSSFNDLPINLNIKSMTGINIKYINAYDHGYKINDILDPTTTEFVVNDNVITDSEIELTLYDVSTKFEVRGKDRFEVSDVTLDTAQYGYSSISAKPIAIKTVGSTSKQIKTVTVSDPSKFNIIGSGNPSIEVGITDNTTFTIKPADDLAVGTHTTTITVTDMDDKIYTATVEFEVEKANINPAVSIVGWTYGSAANTPSVTGNTGSGTVTYEYKVKGEEDSTYSSSVPTNAGDYTIKAIIGSTDNYNGKEVTTDFKISKKLVTFTVTIRDQEFNNNNQVMSAWYTLSDPISSMIKQTRAYIKEGSDKYVGTQIGVYDLTLNDEGFKNYTFAEGKTGSGEDEFEITPVTSTLTLKSDVTNPEIFKTKTLDLSSLIELSNSYTTDITYIATDLKDGVTLVGSTLSASSDAVINQISRVTAKFAGKDLNEDGVPEYTSSSDLIIDIKTVTKPSQALNKTLNDDSVVYGSSYSNPVSIATGDGTLSYSSSDSAIASINENGEISIHKVGTTTITITASETESYAETPFTYDLEVTAKPLTVIVGTFKITKEFDGATTVGAKSGEFALTGIINSDNVSVIVTPQVYSNANVHTENQTLTLSLSGDDKDNYSLETTSLSIPCEITKKTITPAITVASGGTYDGSAKTPSVTVKDGETTLDSSQYDLEYSNNTDAGTASVKITSKSTSNYNWTEAITTFSISKGTYSEAITYTKEVLENHSVEYCISISDLNLPLGFVDVKMHKINAGEQLYLGGVINNLNINKETYTSFCIETGNASAGNSVTFGLEISSKNYENKEVNITVITIAKEPVTIDGLTYTSRDYNNTPMVPTGTLTHTGYTGTIDVLYEGTDGTIYNSTTAPTNVGKYKVTYSIPDTDPAYSGSKVYTFEIKKATPIYSIPTGLTGIVGDELSSVTLPSGFTWNEEDTVLVEGNQSYKGIYTPTDTNNYKTITDLNISVYVKNKYTISTDVNGGNGTISSSATVVEGTYYDVTFTPATGYMIDTVKVNGEQITVASNTYRITNITENKNVVVTYKKIPFTITVNEVTGATITPNGTINVLYGDNKEITITANLGYRLKSVKVNDEEKLPLTENKITLTNITEDQEVVVVVEKIEYDVTNGDGQKHIIGKNEDATFRIDADKDLFLKVYLNDEELDSAFYTITEGSTIITLKQDFLNNLLPNTYNLKVTFSDGGEATATFVIAQPKENNPKTGDPIMLSIILGSVSLIGLLGAGIYLKKKNA